MYEPVCQKPLSWDLLVGPGPGEWGFGGRRGGETQTDRQTEEEGKKERGGEESFLQQLMARQTGPVPQNTHFTLQIAPKT